MLTNFAGKEISKEEGANSLTPSSTLKAASSGEAGWDTVASVLGASTVKVTLLWLDLKSHCKVVQTA